MADRELSDAEIEELQTPKKGSSYTVPGTKKQKKYDPSIRTVANWFKLPHTMTGECEVPSHDEQRIIKGEKQTREKPRLFFVNEKGMKMCRWCFVESRDLQ